MADLSAAPDDRELVIFDVNVYLDVARLLGEPFSWTAFDAAIALNASELNPHPTDARVDSLRALATIRTPRSPAGLLREVWTSDHVNLSAAFKATQAVDAKDPRDRGLGWSQMSAQNLIDDLIWGVVDLSDGDSIGEVPISYGSPPLDNEDGRVFATARDAGFPVVDHYDRFVVTRDVGFIEARLPGDTVVMHPSDWVGRHRAEERAVAFKRLLGA